jgi:hypothetical protein
MTLIELVITMVLVALISPLVYQIINAGTEAYKAGSVLSSHTVQTTFAFDQIALDVERARSLIYSSALEFELEIENSQSQIRTIRYYLDGYNDGDQSGSAPYTLLRADSTNGFAYGNGVPVMRGVAHTPAGPGWAWEYFNYRNASSNVLSDIRAVEWSVVVTEDTRPVTFAMRARLPF